MPRGKGGKGGLLTRTYYELSEALQAIIGKKKANRPEIMKGLWAYVKKHKLQDPNNKRTIVFDEKFMKVFSDGKGHVECDMFYLAKGVTPHLRRIKEKARD